MKLLIFIPSPRDLRQFHQAINKIRHDKLWKKYMPYKLRPYQQAKEFFLQHTEYTHLAICPDDLMVTPKGVAKLVKDATKYDVVSGLCNVNNEDLTAKDPNYAVTHNLPTLERKGRVYDWLKKSQTPKNQIMEVPWSGTAFMIMARRVVEKMQFLGDGPANGDAGFSFDVGIAHDLMAAKIPQYVDTGVFFEHYRSPYAKILNLYEPQTWHDTADGRTGQLTEPELIDVDDIHDIVFAQPKLPDDGREHTLSCQRCGATVAGIKFEEMAERLDHAIGLSRARPCGADKKDLLWDGMPIYDTVGRITLRLK